MVRLTYITNMSLDGYIEDRHRAFDFGPMDDELFATYTELLGTVGTFLYGRRLYETMAGWETMPELAAQSSLAADFAQAWQAPSKVVYSTTLATVPTADTRIERAFDITAVRQLEGRREPRSSPWEAPAPRSAGPDRRPRRRVHSVRLAGHRGRRQARPPGRRAGSALNVLDERRFVERASCSSGTRPRPQLTARPLSRHSL